MANLKDSIDQVILAEFTHPIYITYEYKPWEEQDLARECHYEEKNFSM